MPIKSLDSSKIKSNLKYSQLEVFIDDYFKNNYEYNLVFTPVELQTCSLQSTQIETLFF